MDKSNYSLLLSLFGLVEVLDGFGLIGLISLLYSLKRWRLGFLCKMQVSSYLMGFLEK